VASSPSVVDGISAAMSVQSLRNEVIASNIANRNAESYQRLKVGFDRAFDAAGRATVVADRSSTPVSMEDDLIALSSNSMQYQALARVLNRYFVVLATITNPNRG
jgi:flagellar basal body rod protein FlgB